MIWHDQLIQDTDMQLNKKEEHMFLFCFIDNYKFMPL